MIRRRKPLRFTKLERGKAMTETGRLTIARLTVHNVLGVEDHTIDLDKVTVLEGENASGKSSHLKALRCALGIDRTSLARLARVGPHRKVSSSGSLWPEGEEPSVEVLLVGDDREVLVSRKGDGSPEVRERDGEDWRRIAGRPVEWLRSLLDLGTVDPAALLAADDETWAKAVLEAMPLESYRRDIALRLAGLTGFRLPPLPEGLHPLEDLEQVEAAVFSARTEVNRQRDREHDAATKLLAGLPADPPLDLEGQVARLEHDVAAMADLIASQKGELSSKRAEMEDVERREFQIAASKIRSDHDAKVAELVREKERWLELLQESTKASRAEWERGVEEKLQALQAQRSELAAYRERLATLRAQQQAAATDRHVRATAAAAQAQADEHAARSAELTSALATLKRYRLELADQLPVKGLAVHFDEKGKKSLTLDGVPLSQVNAGRLVELATEVSLLRSNPPADGRPYLPLVLLDGIERLDPVHRAALLREVASRGAQVVAACVGPEALRVLRGTPEP